MPNATPPAGFPTDLWNLAAILTTIQQLQAQVQPITAQQATDLQAQLTSARPVAVSKISTQ